MNVAQAADEPLSHHHYIAQLQLNSSGESSRGTNSPATSDFGHDFDGATPAGLLPSTSHSLSHSPCEDSSSSRYRAMSPDLAYQLQPLAEMEVIGACRRGRRRGRRNRTAAERESEVSQRRLSKNARERQRVENVKNEYARLQKLLGLSEQLENEPKERRRHCKLRTLTTAIERIRTLMAELQLRSAGMSDEVPARTDPSPQQGQSSHAATGQLNGSCDSLSGYWQCGQHPSSIGLSCGESSVLAGGGREPSLLHMHGPTLPHQQPPGCAQLQSVPSLSPPFQSIPPVFSYTPEAAVMDTLCQSNSGHCFPTISSVPHPPSVSGAVPSGTPLNPLVPPFAHSPSDAIQCYPNFSSPRVPPPDPVAAVWAQSLPPFSTFMPYDFYSTYTGEDGYFYPPPPPPPPPPAAAPPIPQAPATTSLQTFSY